MDFPHLRRVYARFHAQGLEILGIAFVEGDDKGKTWLRRYLEDHDLTWPTVAAGEMWDSGPASSYEIRYIPFNFLLDRDGRVIALDLRGEALAARIEKAIASPTVREVGPLMPTVAAAGSGAAGRGEAVGRKGP